MMQWVPYGAPEAEFKDHIRTFAAVFPNVMVVQGAGGYGVYMLGSDARPDSRARRRSARSSARPGVLEDISSAYDSPATPSTTGSPSSTPAVARRRRRSRLRRRRPTRSPTTDPRPEYFLLRRLSTGRRVEPGLPSRLPPQPSSGPDAILRPMTTQTLDREPACPGPTLEAGAIDADSRPVATAFRAERAAVRRHPAGDLGRPRRPEPVGDAVLRLGLPPRVVGRLRRERPRGDARGRRGRRARRRPRRAGRDRAAHASPRGRADRRRDPHDDAPRR